MRELVTAVEEKMPIVCVVDLDKGDGLTLKDVLSEEMLERCTALLHLRMPAEQARVRARQVWEKLRIMLSRPYDDGGGCVPCGTLSRADLDLKVATHRLIGQQALRAVREGATPSLSSRHVYLPGELEATDLGRAPPIEEGQAHVYISPHNPEAEAVLRLLEAQNCYNFASIDPVVHLTGQGGVGGRRATRSSEWRGSEEVPRVPTVRRDNSARALRFFVFLNASMFKEAHKQETLIYLLDECLDFLTSRTHTHTKVRLVADPLVCGHAHV